MPRLQAQRTLEAMRFSNVRVTAGQVFDLVHAATGSRDEAEQAFIRYRRAELRSGQMPAE